MSSGGKNKVFDPGYTPFGAPGGVMSVRNTHAAALGVPQGDSIRNLRKERLRNPRDLKVSTPK